MLSNMLWNMQSSNSTLKTEKEHDRYRRRNFAGQILSSNYTSVHKNNEKTPKKQQQQQLFSASQKINSLHKFYS